MKSTCIDVAIGFDKLSLPTSYSVLELSLVEATFMPGILSEPIGLTEFVVSHIGISIDEDLLSFAMLQEILELTFISTVLMFKNSFPMLPIIQPLTFIAVALRRSPDPKPTFNSFLPIALEFLSIVPLEGPIALPLPVHKVPFVHTIDVPLAAFHLSIIVVHSFEDLFLCYVYA